MEKILGLPRNAAIVIGAVVATVAAMAAGFLIPWNNNNPPAEESGAAPPAAVAGSPANPSPASTPGRIMPTGAGSADPAFTGLPFKRISVDFDNLPFDQAMQAFSDAAGIPVDSGGVSMPPTFAPPPVTMHLKNAPFLEGLLQLANNTRTQPQEYTDAHVSLRVNGDAAVGKWSVNGPLAIVIQRIQTSVDLTRTSASGSLQGTLTFDFYSDPAIKVAQYPTTLSFDQFEDEKHQVFFAGNAWGSSNPSRTMPRATLQMPMSLPADHGRKVSIMRGSGLFTIASRSERVQTSGPDDTVTKNVGELGIEILPIKTITPLTGTGAPAPVNKNYTLTVRYHRRVPDPDKWNRLVNLLSRIQPEVFDLNDVSLTGNYYSNGSERQGEDILVQTYTIRPNPQPNAQPEPHHVCFELPADMRDVRVPFEFKDLILP